MHDSRRVCGNQRRRDLTCNVEHFDELQRSLAQTLSQRQSVDKLSRDVNALVYATNFVDGQNVRMVECGCGLRFVNETLDAALLRGDFIGEELKGDRTAELSVL